MRKAWQGPKGIAGWTLAIIALLIVVRPAESATVVVPNAQASVVGNGLNIAPFSCAAVSTSMRYQQVYLGSEVGSGTITEIRLRQAAGEGAFGPTNITGVTITLSSTTAAPDGLSATFANNIGADVTTVFSGNLSLSSAACGAGPCLFDIVIPLQTPFSFNATAGLNLLLDVTIPTCVIGNAYDVQDSVDSVSRALASGSGSPTASATDTIGLITQFTFTPAIPTLSEWAMIGMILILVGIPSGASAAAPPSAPDLRNA